MIGTERHLALLPARPRVRLLRLGESATRDRNAAGAKAAALADLICAGFPVPPGIVIPVGAREFLGPLLGWYESLGPAEPVAVRLSPVSGAVPFAARLDVRGVRDLLVAVRDALRAEEASGKDAAILLQPTLRAEASGILFPASPVRGESSRFRIRAVPGPGGVAPGQEAEEIVLDARTGRTICGPPEPTSLLPLALRRRLAALAVRAERVLDGPREIGWAARGDALHVLTARTATRVPSAFPDRPTPFGRSYEAARREARSRPARAASLLTLRDFISAPADVRAFRLRTVPAHRRRVRDLESRIARVGSVADAADALRESVAARLKIESESGRVSGRAGRGPLVLRRAASLFLRHPALARERRTFREARDDLVERSEWLVRLALAVLGEKLAGAGLLGAAEDVTLLTLSEACAADRADLAPTLRARALARRAEEIVALAPRLPGRVLSRRSAAAGA